MRHIGQEGGFSAVCLIEIPVRELQRLISFKHRLVHLFFSISYLAVQECELAVAQSEANKQNAKSEQNQLARIASRKLRSIKHNPGQEAENPQPQCGKSYMH